MTGIDAYMILIINSIKHIFLTLFNQFITMITSLVIQSQVSLWIFKLAETLYPSYCEDKKVLGWKLVCHNSNQYEFALSYFCLNRCHWPYCKFNVLYAFISAVKTVILHLPPPRFMLLNNYLNVDQNHY